MNGNYLLASLAILLSLSTACGKSAAAQEEASQAMAPGFQALQGKWLADCQTRIDHGILVAGSGNLTFTGDQVYATMQSYSDENCKKPQFKVEFFGSYYVGSTDARLEASALPIDFKLVRETYTIYDPALIETSGSHGGCNLGGMKVGVPRDYHDGDGCMREWWIGQSPFRAFKVSGGSLRLSEDRRSGYSDEYRMIGFVEATPMRHE